MQNASTEAINTAFKANLATVKIDDVARVGSRLSEGYSGKLVSFGFEPMAGLKIPVGEQQKFTFGGTEFTIDGTPEAETETGLRHALMFKTEDGMNVFPSQLRRSAKTTINNASARKLTTEGWNALVGKTLTVVSVTPDKSVAQIENRGKDNERERIPNAFVVTIG